MALLKINLKKIIKIKMLFSIQINILILLLISIISSNSQSQDYCLDQASNCSPYFYEKCCLGFTFYSFYTLF